MKFFSGVLIILLPSITWAYGYQYMRENRARANKIAERIYVSETGEAPHAFEEIKEIKKEAKKPQACLKKLRRQAVRDKGDGILNLKYEGVIESDVLTCKGKLIKWKTKQDAETQPSTATPETQPH